MADDCDLILSKSDFIKSLGCVRRLWLAKHRPDLKPELSASTLDLISVGKQIGEIARLRYPQGILVPRSDDPAAMTAELIASGATCLFEATVASEGRHARIDILWKSADGTWTIDEVKSSTIKEPAKVKSEHVMDLAFQVLTATRAGYDVGISRLVLVDKNYVWPGETPKANRHQGQMSLFGDDSEADENSYYDPMRLLGAVDVTLVVAKVLGKAEAQAEFALRALASPTEPDVETNTHCKSCDYFSHCFASTDTRHIVHLSGVRPREIRELRLQGFETIDQITDEYGLTDKRLRVREAIRSGLPQVGPGLADALQGIQFPAAFIDYETTSTAFPVVPGTRPYQAICFQWSAHVLEGPIAPPTHSEFLALDRADPREAFCRTLWDTIKDCRSIVHYTGYEITQMKMMVEDGIPLADEVLALLEQRSVDLERIVDAHIYLPEFNGRTSIKVVLPALVPGMSYKDMLIGDGLAAALGYREMIQPKTPAGRKAVLREALLRYCEQDTLAMVEIYRALQQMI